MSTRYTPAEPTPKRPQREPVVKVQRKVLQYARSGSQMFGTMDDAYSPKAPTSGISPVVELSMALTRARNKSRSIATSTPLGVATIRSYKSGLVDGQGLNILPRVLGQDEQPMTEASEFLLTQWNRYISNPRAIDYTQQHTFQDLLEMMIAHWVVDGEAFIRIQPSATYGASIQIIDPAFIPVNLPVSMNPMTGNREGIMGIEFNKKDMPIRYNIAKPENAMSPYQSLRISAVVPARAMLHLHEPLFAWQVRGVPFFTPIANLARNEQLFLVAAVGAAQHSAQVLNYIVAAPAQRAMFDEDGTMEDAAESISDVVTPEAMGGNMPLILEQGLDVKQLKGNFPDSATEPFTNVTARIISSGLGITPFQLYGITKGLNYSTSRAMELPVRSNLRRLTRYIRSTIVTPIYRTWLGRMLMKPDFVSAFTSAAGAGLPVTDFDRMSGHSYLDRGFEGIDPQKDANAVKIKLELGLISKSQAMVELGVNPYATLAGFELDERLGFAATEPTPEPEPEEPVDEPEEDEPTADPDDDGDEQDEQPKPEDEQASN